MKLHGALGALQFRSKSIGLTRFLVGDTIELIPLGECSGFIYFLLCVLLFTFGKLVASPIALVTISPKGGMSSSINTDGSHAPLKQW